MLKLICEDMQTFPKKKQQWIKKGFFDIKVMEISFFCIHSQDRTLTNQKY